MALTHELCVRHLVCVDIHLDLLTECLLDGVKLDQVLLELGLVFDPLGGVIVLFEFLELVREVIHLVKLVCLLDVEVWLLTGSAVVGHSRTGNGRVLLWVVWVLD